MFCLTSIADNNKNLKFVDVFPYEFLISLFAIIHKNRIKLNLHHLQQ